MKQISVPLSGEQTVLDSSRPLGLYQRLGLIALGVVLYVVAFPKYGWFVTGWIALVPLFVASRGVSPGQSFRYYFVYTFLVNAAGFYWMAPITAPGFVISALLMALYSGLGGVIVAVVRRELPRVPYWLVIALAWGATEYLKSQGFYAFPWLALGYSQARNLWAVQTASVFGVYGISAAMIAVSALLTEVIHKLRLRQWKQALLPWGAVVLGIVLVVHIGGLLSLEEPSYSERPVVAGILQGGIAQDIKWDYEFRSTGETYRVFERQVDKILAEVTPDLIIWPESSASCVLSQTPAWQDRVKGIINRSGCRHLVGTQERLYTDDGGELHHNAALLMEPGNDEVVEAYYKIHLVPFAEVIPFGKDLPIIRDMIKRASNFDPGTRMPLFTVTPGRGAEVWPTVPIEPETEGEVSENEFNETEVEKVEPLVVFRSPWMPEEHEPDYPLEVTASSLPVPPLPVEVELANFGLLICFESIYPEMGLEYTRRGADFLVVTTNDAWFRQSANPYQHAEISVLRAVESRVPLLRAANAGISLWIDPWGRPHDETTLDSEAAIVVKVPEAAGPTLYMFWGDVLPQLELAVVILLTLYTAWLTLRRRIRRNRELKRLKN